MTSALHPLSPYETTLGALGVAVAAGVPTVLWGGPGEGKTSVVAATAAALGLHLEVVLASVREPTDFAGLPVVHAGRVSLAPPDWAQRLVEADARGQVPAVFFDEVNCASPATQAALLRVCCDRVVGDLALPAATVVLAAANPPSVAADGWELAAPMANRFCHLDWRLPADVVAAGFLGGWPEPVVPALPDDLAPFLAQALAQVSSYLRVRPGDVSVLPTDPAAAGRAFPTPRTWEYAARLLAVCDAAGSPAEVRRRAVAGVVGEAAALQLLTFLEELDLPDPEQVLRDPDAFVLPERGDRAYAALACVVAAVLSAPTPERWQAGVRVVARAAQQGKADVGAVAMQTLVQHRPPATALPVEVRAFVPVLTRAGLLAAS
jgi:ATPase family associated with various cellular activities (AAA)